MNRLSILLTMTLLGAAPLARSQVNIPNPNSPGMSPQSAVRLVAPSDFMVDRQIQRWLQHHYPGWNAQPHEITEIGMERYAVVYITAPNNPGRRIYFRLAKGENDDGFGMPEL